MACSNPIRLDKVRDSIRVNHSDFELNNLRRSFNEQSYTFVPCRYCLNCRVDRQNEFVDRAEYEYISYGCGAFVTFTYGNSAATPTLRVDGSSTGTAKTIAFPTATATRTHIPERPTEVPTT